MRNKSKYIILSITGIVIFTIFVLKMGQSRHLNLIFKFGWLNTLYAVLLTLLIIITTTFRLKLLIALQHAEPMSFFSLFKASVWGRMSSQTTSQIFGDFGVMLFVAKQRTISYSILAYSILWDKILETLTLLSTLLGYFFIKRFIHMDEAFGLFLLISIVILIPLSMGSIDLMRLIIRKRKELANSVKPKLKMYHSVIISLLSLLKYTLVALRYYVVIAFFHIPVRLFDVFFGTGLTQIGNMIAITPGGLGFIETGWIGFFKSLHVSEEYLGAFLLSQRVIILFSVCVIFVLFNGIDLLKILHGRIYKNRLT